MVVGIVVSWRRCRGGGGRARGGGHAMRQCRVEEDRIVMCRGWEFLWDQNKHAGGRCRVQEDRSVMHEGRESVCPHFVYIVD